MHRVQPIDARAGSKTSIYLLNDHYFRFWFRLVSTQQSKIEMYLTNEALAYLRKGLPGYMGYAVEDIVTELFRERYTRVGKWWHQKEEIDLVSVDEVGRTVTFVEIKWRSQPVDRKIVKELGSEEQGSERYGRLRQKIPRHKQGGIQWQGRWREPLLLGH